MKVYLTDIKLWLNGLNKLPDIINFINNKTNSPQEYSLPKPLYYPKAQLRRLSPFSKVILDCLDMPAALQQSLPLVFSSQHGDLAKTVKLIQNAALAEELSPTHFALSVHNSTTGLFGIATKNKAATTTISAGGNTFSEGLVEAAMQAQQDNTDVLYVYCDFPVPEQYSEYESEKPARCIAMVLSPSSKGDLPLCAITVEQTNSILETTNKNVDLWLDFIYAYNKQTHNSSAKQKIFTNNYTFWLENS